MTRRHAVVFAYHDVGVRCLLTLLAGGVDVALVVTHRDRPDERIWFASVHDTAHEHGIPVRYAEDFDATTHEAAVAQLDPDFIFSFYFRNMLPQSTLRLARRGAYNMHGSLLPKYRGRVPVNWAIIHGETETGATLHEMTVKPDAGAIVGQTAVPILPDDTAREVFGKVVVAAELTLWRALPGLIEGNPFRMPNDLAAGSYFGGRKPEDGRIDWRADAVAIHNLVRAVAPPYPGAFTRIGEHHVVIERTRLRTHLPFEVPLGHIVVQDERAIARAGDGVCLDIVAARVGDRALSEAGLALLLGDGIHRLEGMP
jgi:methionyl-tRNA formyltransferase